MCHCLHTQDLAPTTASALVEERVRVLLLSKGFVCNMQQVLTTDEPASLISLSLSSHPVTQTYTAYLHALSLEELARRCKEELGKYNRGEFGDDCYALEIFHRAMSMQEVRAWEILQQCFSSVVLGWLRRHTRRDRAYALDSEENYVAQAFTRFWQASVNNPCLRFASLASALNYLRASLNGAIMDTLRSYNHPNEVPLPEPGDAHYGDDLVAEEPDAGDELWDAVSSLLHNGRERRLAYLHFHCGLKAREIVQFCPHEFNDVQEIYRLRHNIFKRLLRHADLLRWRLSTIS
jgi:hypothetical protein